MLKDPASSSAEDDSTPSGGEVELATTLACENLAAVRGEVRRLLAEMDAGFVDDVQLVCTELAANACDHAEHPRDLVLRRQTHGGQEELLIEVRDSTPHRTPRMDVSTAGENRGHGMRMVDSLCREWGVRPGGATKVVWAAMPLPDRTPRRHARPVAGSPG